MSPKTVAWALTAAIGGTLAFLAYEGMPKVGDQVEVDADIVSGASGSATQLDPSLSGKTLIIKLTSFSGNTATGVAVGVIRNGVASGYTFIDRNTGGDVSLSFAKNGILQKHSPPLAV